MAVFDGDKVRGGCVEVVEFFVGRDVLLVDENVGAELGGLLAKIGVEEGLENLHGSIETTENKNTKFLNGESPSRLKPRLYGIFQGFGGEFAIGGLCEQFDAFFGVVEDAAAAFDEFHALLVFGEGFFEADLAGLDGGDDLLQLCDGFFEVFLWGVFCHEGLHFP